MIAALAIIRRYWQAIAIVAALMAVSFWHMHEVNAARREGAAVQRLADNVAVNAAAVAATAKQSAIIAARHTADAAISKDTTDALIANNDALRSHYDALRLRWVAYNADSRRANGGATVAVPSAASGADDATCAASGWIRFDAAATTALAADEAIAKDDAWIRWAADQAAAWPK